MKTIKNWVLGLILISALHATSQDECILRTHRYPAAPKVTTLYPCNSLESKDSLDFYKYNISILTDSITSFPKNYKIYLEANHGFDSPVFELRTSSGDTILLFPSYTNKDESYMEAVIPEQVLVLIKLGDIKYITINHRWVKKGYPTPSIACGNFFQNFITKH